MNKKAVHSSSIVAEHLTNVTAPAGVEGKWGYGARENVLVEATFFQRPYLNSFDMFAAGWKTDTCATQTARTHQWLCFFLIKNPSPERNSALIWTNRFPAYH